MLKPANTNAPHAVRLDVPDRAALLQLAESLGEIMADMWIDGKLEIDEGEIVPLDVRTFSRTLNGPCPSSKKTALNCESQPTISSAGAHPLKRHA